MESKNFTLKKAFFGTLLPFSGTNYALTYVEDPTKELFSSKGPKKRLTNWIRPKLLKAQASVALKAVKLKNGRMIYKMPDGTWRNDKGLKLVNFKSPIDNKTYNVGYKPGIEDKVTIIGKDKTKLKSGLSNTSTVTPSSLSTILFTPGILNNGQFTPTGETITLFDKTSLISLPKPEPLETFGPGTFNTNITYNRDNIRANRGINYSNVNEYWDYLNNNKDSNDYKLFLNIMRTTDGNLNRDIFDLTMTKYGISGNLGRRDSGRLANLLNDLNLIGTEGSDARNSFIDSYNNYFNLALKEAPIKKWVPQGQDWRSNLLNVLSLSYRKKGGTLSPRDPVKRFRSFLKGGSLLKSEIRTFKTGGTQYSDETKKLLLEMINSGITKVMVNGKEKVLKADGYRGPITEAAIALYLKSKGSGSVTKNNKSYQLDYNKVKLLGDARRAQAQPMINNFNNYVEGLNKNASKNIEFKKKAYQTANKNTRAPMAPNNLSTLQENLWNIGAFNGVKNKRGLVATVLSAIDGLPGPMTDLALKNAESMGYFIDEKAGTVSRTNPESPKLNKPGGLASMYEMTHAALTGGMSKVPGVPSEIPTPLYMYLKNLYPYGYLDEPGTADLGGFTKKVFGGLTGPSERKKHLDAIIDLDLNDPKLLLEAMKHRKYFDNFKYSSILDIQLSARLREDANRLYSGMPLKYNSFIINPDYKLPEAEALGVPTYTFADPELRRRYLNAAFNFNRNLKVGKNRASDNLMNVFNRFTIGKSHNDNSGFYREKWDLLNLPGANVFIADTIPANIGGRGGNSFKPSYDNTPLSFTEFLKNMFK